MLAFEAKLENDGMATLGEEKFEVTKGMASWKKGSRKVVEIKYTPSVIEPSFGELRNTGVLCCNLNMVFLYMPLHLSFSQSRGQLGDARSRSPPPIPRALYRIRQAKTSWHFMLVDCMFWQRRPNN